MTCCGELVELGAAARARALDVGLGLGQREAADPGIDIVGGLGQRGGRQPGRQVEMRFSTWPSSATSTTSALSGSSRTNSMCFSRAFDFAASTTPAQRDRPEISSEASVSTVSIDLP